MPAQVDFSGTPLNFYGQQWDAAVVSDNGYIVFGESFYPYEPTTFGKEAFGTPKASGSQRCMLTALQHQPRSLLRITV